MYIQQYIALICIGCAAIGWVDAAYFDTNFSTPYDIIFRLPQWSKGRGKLARVQLSQSFEYGSTQTSRNAESDKTDLLSLYNCGESTIAMLKGQCQSSCATKLLEQLSAAVSPFGDDGSRGRIRLFAEYEEWNLNFHNRLNFAIPGISGNFHTALHIPVRHRAFKDVRWADQTKEVFSTDLVVKELLSSCAPAHLQSLGNLSIGNVSETGIGDIALMFGWHEDFFRVRENLKNVRLSFRAGVSAPTGSRRDIDSILSLPLGLNGAWSLPASLAIDMSFAYDVRLGLEFELRTTFDETRQRRVKTDRCQTDLFLLNTACTRKQFSRVWKFNLYGGFEDIYNSGLSVFMHYQYAKRDEDTLFAKDSNELNHAIINSASHLDQWSMHNLVFQARYDGSHLCKKSFVMPQVSFFYKIPVGGRRCITAHTIGVQCALNF